jgi:uncharacterized membrane protein
MKKILSVVAVAALIFALSVPAFAAATPSVTYSVEIDPDSVVIATETPDEVAQVLTEETKVADDVKLASGVTLDVKPISDAAGNGLSTDEHAALTQAVQEIAKKADEITAKVQEQVANGSISVPTTNPDNKAETIQNVKVTDVSVTLAEIDLVDEDGNSVSVSDATETGSVKVAIASAVVGDGQAVLDVLRLVGDEWKSVGADNFSYENGKLVVTFDHFCSVAFVIGTVEPVYGKTQSAGSDTESGTGSSTGTPAKNDPSKSPQTGYDVFGWAAAVSALVLAAGYCFVSARKVTE